MVRTYILCDISTSIPVILLKRGTISLLTTVMVVGRGDNVTDIPSDIENANVVITQKNISVLSRRKVVFRKKIPTGEIHLGYKFFEFTWKDGRVDPVRISKLFGWGWELRDTSRNV